MPFFEDIAVDYAPGTTQEVTMHDGSKLYLKKLEEDYDPTDKIGALRRLHETARRGEFATGLIYIEPDRDDFLTQLERRRRAARLAPAVPRPAGQGSAGRDHGRAAVAPRWLRMVEQSLERTLAIIKPDAVERHLAGRIIQRIEAKGFGFKAMRPMHLSKGQAEGVLRRSQGAAVFRQPDGVHVVGAGDRARARSARRHQEVADADGRHRSGQGRRRDAAQGVRPVDRAQRHARIRRAGDGRLRNRSISSQEWRWVVGVKAVRH